MFPGHHIHEDVVDLAAGGVRQDIPLAEFHNDHSAEYQQRTEQLRARIEELGAL